MGFCLTIGLLTVDRRFDGDFLGLHRLGFGQGEQQNAMLIASS